MSSSRLNFFRKRSSNDENSSDDITPPVKKLRKSNGETSTFPFSLLCDFTSKCKQMLQWLCKLPINDILKEKMLRRSLQHQPADIIDLDDDGNDKDVINVDDEILVLNDEEVFPSKENMHTDNTFHNGATRKSRYSFPTRGASGYSAPYLGSNRTSFGHQSGPLSSTPFYRSTKPMNGCGKSMKPKSSPNKMSNSRQLRTNQFPVAPITNPGIDVEILLDSNKIPVEAHVESDISMVEQPIKTSRRTLPVMHKFGSSFKDSHVSEKLVVGRPRVPFYAERIRTPTSTVHEVVRLQEKAQYQLMLDKMVSGNNPVYRPLKPVKESVAEQIDLTRDDQPVLLNTHFKKETLQKPIEDFMQKYYKPYSFHVLSEKPLQSSFNTTQTSKVDYKEEKEKDIEVLKVNLPVYKPKSKKKSDFFSEDWIAELRSTIKEETEKCLKSITEQEVKLERFRKRRDAKIAELTWARDQLKLSGAIFSDSFDEKDEFPELTPEAENVIDSAFGPGPQDEKLSSLDKIDITRNDIYTLQGLQWLNDQVINFYFALIVERSKLDNYPSVYAFNSFFYTSLRNRGESAVLRWTRRIDIFSYDLIMVPLHLGVHWALAVIDNRSKKIQYYDSLRNTEENCVYLLQNYLCVEMKDKKKQVMNISEYSTEVAQDIPHQMNGSDCGMFALKYAEYISRDAPITFTQTNMQYFRRRMVYELLTKQLM